MGWPGPPAALVFVARSPWREVTAHPPPGSPRYAQGRRRSVAERFIFPSLITKTFLHQFQVGKQQKSKSFFHAFQAPLDRLADGLLMHTISLSNRFDAYAKNDVSVDPAALDLRQGIERVPQPDKPLLEFQDFLGRGLMQAGGVFDPVLTVQGILRFVPGEPPLVGRFIADAGPERLGHFLGDFDKLILRVPIIKIFQIWWKKMAHTN